MSNVPRRVALPAKERRPLSGYGIYLTQSFDPQPPTLAYSTERYVPNAYQRASTFVLRVIGLALIAYVCIGIIGLLGGMAVGMYVYPLGRHLLAIAEYALLGVFAATFAKPIGRWLGSAG